jgi:hypothetical protein
MTRLLHAVVCPLHPLPVGAGFPRREWPLHVTLLGNFAWDGDEAAIIRRVADVVEDRIGIDAVVGDEAMFGAEHTIAVNTLVPHPELIALHESLIDERMTFVEPQYLRAGYRAHITHFPAGRRHAGDAVRLEQVVLAEMVGAAASIRAVWDWG